MSNTQRQVSALWTDLNMDWDCALDAIDLALSHTKTETTDSDIPSLPDSIFDFPFHLTYREQTFNMDQEALFDKFEYSPVHPEQDAKQIKTEPSCPEIRLDKGIAYPGATISPSQLSLCTMVSLGNDHLGPSMVGMKTGQCDPATSCFENGEHPSRPAPSVSSKPREWVKLELDPALATTGLARKKTPEQRALVLHKRKLRNRQSAKRSRQKRLGVVHELLASIRAIREESEELKMTCARVVEENCGLKQQLARIHEHAI